MSEQNDSNSINVPPPSKGERPLVAGRLNKAETVDVVIEDSSRDTIIGDTSQGLETPESTSKKHRVGKFIGKMAMAAACIIPPADLALSDIITAKEYELVQENITLASKSTERGLEVGLTAGIGMAESLALGQAIAKRKKLQNAFQDFEEYQEEKQESMGRGRKALSTVVNAPFSALIAISNGFEKMGEKIAKSDSKVVRALGQIAVDAGKVNAIGTSTIVLSETMNGQPTPVKRQLYFGGLIMGSWLTVAEGIRQAYRSVPVLRPPLAAVGKTYEALTTIDFSSPLSTPIGTLAIGSTVAALAYNGWKLEGYRQKRDALAPNPEQLRTEIEDFQSHNPDTTMPITKLKG